MKNEGKTKTSEKVQEESKEESVEYDEFGFRVLTNKELDKLIPPFD